MIVIVGAGRHGLYSGYLLAKNNFEVLVIEKEKSVGNIKGTDIVSTNLRNFIKIRKNFIQNKVYGAVFRFKDNEVLIRRKKPVAYVLKRKEFEEHLLNLFEAVEGKVKFNCKFISGNFKKIVVKENAKNNYIKFKYLIGADGVNSAVARNYEFYEKQEVICGYEWLVQGFFEKKYVEVNFNIPKYFSWIVPENEEIARVGFITDSPNLILKKFKKFVESNYKVLHFYGKPIPIYNPKVRWQKKNVFLLGDAAGMTKATTGGGTIPGFIGVNYLVKSILNNISFDATAVRLKTFLVKHLVLRKLVLNKTTGKTKIRILKVLKVVLETFGDMDFVIKTPL